MWARRMGLAVALLVAAGAQGQPQTAVPPQLEEWRGWALDGKEHVRCPFLYASAAAKRDDFVCAWPGRLEIAVAAERGTFEQTWTIFAAAQWVSLPGGQRSWPRQVTAAAYAGDGAAPAAPRRLEVVLHQGAPSVRLPPGRHRLAGAFVWGERPVALPVPAASGVVALDVDGRAIARPRVEDGRLWLGEGEQAEASEDALDVRVFRRVADDVPTRLRTVFAVDVSGGVREEAFAPALPAGFVPLAVESALPALLDPGGELRVQVRPGQWRIQIDARAPAVQDGVSLATERRNLPDFEMWSYQANPRLRDTVAEAASTADPRLVDAPWVDLPTFRIRPGERLAIVERRRGQADAEDALTLTRKLWQDFDGNGFAFADEFDGVLRASSRLDMAGPYQLLAAEEWGENLLVTAEDARSGVEVAGPELNLRAHGRIDAGGAMPVVGWRTRLETMTATLNLPPGAKLLAAFGVDDAPTSLAGRWRLLDFFVLLIVTLAAARLFGHVVAVFAFVALLLSYHEPGAPVWTWLNLLAATALARVAPEGRLLRIARGYRVAAFGVLLLFLVPFAVAQIRIALFPQLETPAHRRAETFGLFEVLSGHMPGDWGIPMLSALSRDVPAARESGQPVAPGVYLRRADEQAAREDGQPGVYYAEGEVQAAREGGRAREAADHGVDGARQTGPGIPAWEWTAYPLSWSGPLDPDRAMRLLILPPWLIALLRFAAVGALGLFAARFAFEAAGRRWRLRLPRRGAVAAGCALAMLGPLADEAAANTPAPELLRELERRLLRPQPCAPRCAEVAAAEVRVDADALTIRLSVHALAQVAIPLPGDASWRPANVTIGRAAAAVVRDDAGVLWALVDAGRHTLELRSPPPAGDTLEIPFRARPRAVAVTAPQWAVAGVEDGVLAAGALHLARLRGAGGDVETAAPSAAGPTTRIPPFVRVERMVRMAREWHVYTTVRRVAPAAGPISLRVPLLDGEAIVSGEHSVEAGTVAVAMSPGQATYSWRSTLPVRAQMTLQAPADDSWREVWRFDIGNVWRVAFDGVPESQRHDGESVRLPRFDPRRGETLAVASQRPEAVPGHTLAFDGAWLETRVGARSRASTLTARYRSTTGASHAIALPARATLKTVRIDGEAQPLALQEGALGLPLPPGEHTVHVAWDEASEAGLLVKTPEVALGAPSSNLVAKLELPASRWLLFAAGPPVGPAILYWAELVALIAAALVLGRLAVAPLRTHHWLLLGVGFSTFSWLAFAVVVAWLLAHGARRKWGKELSRRLYNTTQIGFAVLTLAAFAAILAGIPHGLLGAPDMSVRGYESAGRELTWFADRTDSALAQASVWSLPMWVYKALILAWALWLSFALLRWLPWVWTCFSEGGLWRPRPDPGGAGGTSQPKSSAAPENAKDNADDAWRAG